MDTLPIISVDAEDTGAFDAWLAAVGRTFLDPPPPPEHRARRLAARRNRRSRLSAAMDGDETVATFESYDADAGAVSDPGDGYRGGSPRLVTVEAISAVTVSSTHRRRGLLTRWMTGALADARDRGMPLASLIASEAMIYGRFGFAPVVDSVTVSIDRRALRPADPTACGGGRHTVRLVEPGQLRDQAPAIYEAARSRQPGAAPREPHTWQGIAENEREPGDTRRLLTLAHTGPEAGDVDGFARLAVSGSWDHRSPAGTAEVLDLSAVDPAVAVCLWRACLSVDLVTTVVAHDRPLQDPVAELLVDRRAARQTARADLYWWRILDVPAALRSRWWAGSARRLVLDVRDPLGHAAGRWSLDVDESGEAQVATTRDTADLSLDVTALTTLLAGQGSLLRLAVVGQVDEHSPGAVAALDRLAWAPSPAHVTYTWF